MPTLTVTRPRLYRAQELVDRREILLVVVVVVTVLFVAPRATLHFKADQIHGFDLCSYTKY